MSPFRSEADAFRIVVIVGAGAIAVIALTLLAGARFGVVLAAGMIGLGLGRLWGSAAGSDRGEAAQRPQGDARRVLVVADEAAVGASALLDEIENRCRGRRGEVLVVTPAVSARFRSPSAGGGDATAGVDERRDEAVAALRAAGMEARGEVGDSDPNVAIRNALRDFPADELVISTQPPGRSRWLEVGVVQKARAQVELPVTHVVVDDAQTPGPSGG